MARYEVELRNIQPGERGQTVVWIENGRWTQGILGPVLRVGRTGEGTVSVIPGHLQLCEANRVVVDLAVGRPVIAFGDSGGGTYIGPPGQLTGEISWRVIRVS